MSAKFGLPSRLEKLEAELRQQVPQDCAVDRDALMYQAGWAAAEVAGRLRWGWPTTSGLLAASVAVLAFFLVRGSEPVPMAEVKTEPTKPAIEHRLPNLVLTPEQPVRVVPVRHWEAEVAALARRHQLKKWDVVDREVTKVASTEVKTARSLMQEFLGETVQAEIEKRGNHGHLFDGRGVL